MNETIFVDGVFFNEPGEKAPDFVKGKISIKVEDFIKFAEENKDNGWVNIDILTSKKTGKPYCKLNTWKKENKQSEPKTEMYYGSVPTIQVEDDEVTPF